MFQDKRRMEDDKLKRLLRDSWPTDAGKDRASFMQRLKLVIPPDHPGLLFLTGKIKRQTINGENHRGETKWRRHSVLTFAASWGFILLVLFLAIYSFQHFYLSNTAPPGPATGDTSGIISSDTNQQKEAIKKYIYRFGNTKIVESRKLTLAEINEEINRIKPAGIEIKITGMDQVEDYYEESDDETYHYIIYELKGIEYLKGDNQDNGFNGNGIH